MNKSRRKSIDGVIQGLETAKELLQQVLDEEQDTFNNMPESLQDGGKGDVAQEAIDNLQNSIEQLEEAIENAETAKG